MNKERKEWCQKYEVNITEGGFIDKFIGLPEHVRTQLGKDGRILGYIGFDGKLKTYEQLTEEEKEDLENEINKIPERIHNYVIGKEPGE